MDTILLSTTYFGPISYFAAIAQAKDVIIEANEHYQKKSYRSRCYIAGPHGKQMLNIPIDRPSGNTTFIKDVLLGKNQNWQNQHWNSIITAYNSSPFLLYYIDEIEAIYRKEYNSLWKLNNELLLLILELLQIDTPIKFTDNFIKTPMQESDLRQSISHKHIINNPKYIQVFSDKHNFIEDLSILDLLFNLGPEAGYYLSNIDLSEI